MKIIQSWKRNTPSTTQGESITVATTYSSLDKGEIDNLEQRMPKGVSVMVTYSEKDIDSVNIDYSEEEVDSE